MADKRSVHTDALDTLGTIISPNEKRDAIHVAVFPAQAGQALAPGNHVTITDDGRAYWSGNSRGVGIVDPFLEVNVKPGEWFWLLIYPRQITSLRHVWEHPGFPAPGEGEHFLTIPAPVEQRPHVAAAVAEIDIKKAEKDASEAWLRNWIDNADCPGFETTIGAMMDQHDNEYVHFYGRDAHGEIPAEAWNHLQIYTGVELYGTERASYFSCSC